MGIDTDNDVPSYAPIPLVGESDMSGDRTTDPDTNSDKGEQPIHRPHAFSLVHGDNGAQVSYGQFIWRYDDIKVALASTGSSAVTEEAGQGVINAFNVKTPTIDNAGGDPMDPTIYENTKYHQLTGYGDVYLYWTTDLDASAMADKVDACWVQVGGPGEDELDSIGVVRYENDRTSSSSTCPTTGQKNGRYRLKLGTVTEDAIITQNHSSDVFWTFTLLIRIGGGTC